MMRAVFRLWLAVAVMAAVLAPVCARADDDAAPASMMVIADFNGDGIADLAQVLPGAGVLTLSLGRGDGTYQAPVSHVSAGSDPRAIVAGDFNGDHAMDLVVGEDDGEVLLFLGDGRGGLQPAGVVARLQSVVSMVAADFNRDGVTDLAVSDWRASRVYVLTGAGNGTFQQGWSFALRMPGVVAGLSVADYNGDGIPDLAVTYIDGDDGFSYQVMLSNGNGMFTLAPNLSLMRDPNSHCNT